MSDKMLDIHGLEHLWQRFLGLFLPRDEVPTKLSEFDNDVGYITEPDMDDATGVLAVEHGGTGSYSTRIALDNLKATRHLVINDGDVASVEEVVYRFEIATYDRPVLLSVMLGGRVMDYFTNGSITDPFVGIVRMNAPRTTSGFKSYSFIFTGIIRPTTPGDCVWGEIGVGYDQTQTPQRVSVQCIKATASTGSGGDVNVIEAISLNGANVPPDSSKRVSLTETDPTVPAWAKASSKPSYTPAEVGAVDKAGDTMTGTLTVPKVVLMPTSSIQDLFVFQADVNKGIFFKSSTQIQDVIYSLYSNGRLLFREYKPGASNYEDYYLPAPDGTYASYNILTTKIGAAEARTAITQLVNDNQLHNITVSADCWVCASLHVTANINGIAIILLNGIPVVNNVATNGSANYWANAQFPCKAGATLQYRINTNATDSYISFLTV